MLKFYVKGRQNPITKATKYYAQIASPEPMSIEAIAKQIAQNCTLTRHDILACLSAFQEQLINMLQDGKSVRLSDLGCFRLTLHSLGTDLKEDFSTNNVKGIRIRFTPAPRLRKALSVGADGVTLSSLEKSQPASSGPGESESM